MHHPERGKHRLGAEPQRSRLPRMPRRTCFTEHLKIVDRRARRAEQRQRFRLCVERVETLRLAGRPKIGRAALEGTSVSVRVDLGGRRNCKKKNKKEHKERN